MVTTLLLIADTIVVSAILYITYISNPRIFLFTLAAAVFMFTMIRMAHEDSKS